MPLTSTQQAIVDAFDVLAEQVGYRVHLLPAPLAIPAEAAEIANLQVGGLYESIDGAFTVRKDQLPIALKAGDLIYSGGATRRIDHIETNETDPLLTVFFTTIEGPKPIPATIEVENNVPVIGGGGAEDPDGGNDQPDPLTQWTLNIVQPVNGGTIEIFDLDGNPITTSTIADNTRIEIRITTGANVELVSWQGDLQQWANQANFLHKVTNHLTITAETVASQVLVFTDLPEQGGAFNWQTGHSHPAGTELSLTYTPPSPQHTLEKFQVNGANVADGDTTDNGIISINGNTIIISDPQQDLTIEAVLKSDCPMAEPTLSAGVAAPDPFPMPGEQATYTVTIPEGQELVRWELDGETIPHNENGSVTITQPAGEFTLEVFLQVITYTLTTPTTPAGNIHLSNYNPEHGEEVTLTFYPATGYGDTSGFQIGDFYTPAPNNSTTWLADKDAAIGVDAEILTFTITATGDNLTFTMQDGNGDPINNPVDYGTEVNVTAIPAEGYEFLNWTGHPVITNTGNNPIQFTADQDAALEAFAQQVAEPTLIGGVVAPDPLPMPGNEATYTVNIPEGQELVRWELDGEEIPHNENGSVTITQPVGEFTIEAVLQTIVYTITIPTIDEGTILVSNETPDHGETVTLTFVPATGYEDTTNFLIGGETIEASANEATWVADENTTVNVDAVIKTYTFTAHGDGNFVYTITNTITGDPINSNPIDHGTPITIQVTPNEGYNWSHWDAHPLINDTAVNPLNIILTEDAAITANVELSFSYQAEFTIEDGVGSISSYANNDLLTEDNLQLIISGALIHNLIGNGSLFTTVQDALYPFWQQGYGGGSTDNAFAGRIDHTLLSAATPEAGVGFYRNTADNNKVEIAETFSTPRVLASINNANLIEIDPNYGKHVQFAVRFNSALGFIPLPLIPFLNNAKNWQDASFIPSAFQGGNVANTRTIDQVKTQLATSGQGGTDHNNYQIGYELQQVQDDAAGFTTFIKDFNQYTIPIHMAAIESALGVDDTNRQSQIDFAIIANDRTVTGTTIDGLNTANPTKIDGAFKIDLTLAK